MRARLSRPCKTPRFDSLVFSWPLKVPDIGTCFLCRTRRWSFSSGIMSIFSKVCPSNNPLSCDRDIRAAISSKPCGRLRHTCSRHPQQSRRLPRLHRAAQSAPRTQPRRLQVCLSVRLLRVSPLTHWARAGTGPPNPRRSVESVYALYQHASSGLLASDHAPAAQAPSSHSHSPALANPNTNRTSAIPFHPATVPRMHPHPGSSPLRSSSGSSEPSHYAASATQGPPPLYAHDNPRSSIHDLNTPSPPLSAALGRHIPNSSSTSSLL